MLACLVGGRSLGGRSTRGPARLPPGGRRRRRPRPRSLPAAAQRRIAALLLHRLPLGHTWFLYILLWLYAGALALVGVAR